MFNTSEDSRQTLTPRLELLLFGFATLIVIASLFWMYFSNMYIIEDYNGEAMLTLTVVAYMKMAQQRGVPIREFLCKDLVFENIKKEDPNAYHCPGKRFEVDYYVHVSPIMNMLYYPFIALSGLNGKTIANFSTTFFIAGLILLAWLTWKIYDKWTVLVVILFLMMSISWLIHLKVAYPGWMQGFFAYIGLAFVLDRYIHYLSRTMLVISGMILACLYNMASLHSVMALLFILMVIIIEGRCSIKGISIDLLTTGISFCFSVLFLVWLYSLMFGLSQADIHRTVLDGNTHRFTGGAVPQFPFSPGGKLWYLFKCTFIDSTTIDHPDKYLEGVPAISWFFSVFFGFGIFYAIRDRRDSDRLILLWLASVFVAMCVYLYAPRYALMGIPAMAIIAARGFMGTLSDFAQAKSRWISFASVAAFILMAGLSIRNVHNEFYGRYMHQKPFALDIDIFRGQYKFSEWLKSEINPETDLVVMSDPTTYPRACFTFYTFEKNYRFCYWMNYLPGLKSKESVIEWEKQLLAKYKKVVFAFTTLMFSDYRTGAVINDPRLFIEAHPKLTPVFVYSYEKRAPSLIAFEITR